MSLDNSYRAYGRYLVALSRLNPLLDAAIVREAGLGPATGAILVAALNAKSRLAVLRGLLLNAGGEKADVVPTLTEIAQEAKRQPLAQGDALPGGTNSLLFQRPDVSGRGAVTAEYTSEEIDALADELEQRVDTVAKALDVTAADLAALKRANDELGSRKHRRGGGGGGGGDDDAE
jgi:hypothetical protein